MTEPPQLRVLHVTRTLGMGGMERVIATLCRSVDQDRFESSVLCLKGRGPLADELEGQGIPVIDLGGSENTADYFAFNKVAKIIRDGGFDVVHTHNTTALLFGASGARLAGVKTVVHTDHARSYPERWRIRIAEHVISRLVYRVVAVSDETRQDLRRHLGIPAPKLVTIPNGIEGERYRVAVDRHAKLAELGLPLDQPVIGVGARLTTQKGLEHLVDAMPLLHDRGLRPMLVIAGEGPERAALEAQARRLGVSDSVRFLGLRLDMPELLQVFDIYAMPSVWEGLPMALLEAMAARRSVVASAVGGIPSVLHDGRSGLLVPPADASALADALECVLTDTALADRLGAEALRLFEQHYSAEAMAQRYQDLYLRRAA